MAKDLEERLEEAYRKADRQDKGLKEELRELKLDLNDAYRRGDFNAVTEIQTRISGLQRIEAGRLSC